MVRQAPSRPQLKRDPLDSSGRPMALRHLLMALGVPTPFCVGAQAPPRTPAPPPAQINCDSAMTTLDMGRCANRAFDVAERELHRYLLEARHLTANRALLDSAQTAWLKYRDVACRAAGSQHEGGSMGPLTVRRCQLRLMQLRTHDLWGDYLRNTTSTLSEPRLDVRR